MKYFAILLVSITVLVSVDATIPNYIHVCNRNDPQVSKCIESNINSMRDRLAKGIPELDVPPLDPLHLGKIVLNLGPGLKAEGKNLKITGAKNFNIKNLVTDLKADTYTFDLSFPEITARGTYELDATIASIPLKGKGPIALEARSVTGRGTLYGKKVPRNGKTLYYFPRLDLKLTIGDYNIKLENLFEGEPAIGEVTNKLLNEEKSEVLASLLPSLEKAVIEHILRTGNGIYKHFTWEEMFLES